MGVRRLLLWVFLVLIMVGAAVLSTFAEPLYQGAQKCADCHKDETTVWKQTKHENSFREIHRKPAVKDIIAAAGGDTNMRRNATCTTCHYTMAKADANAAAAAASGPSCESCHGASSEWMAIHNDYGGPSVKREAESPAHKAERQQKSTRAGMIWPTMLYDIASNCLTCHTLAQPSIAPETFEKMIAAGHPAGSSFDLIQYSQGTVRHRFYPPDVTKNAEMTPAQQARMFVTGHAAALVKVAAHAKVNNAKLQETVKTIETRARAALDAIKGQVPEAAALIAEPTDANARKLVDAIASKDLSAQVGTLMPAKGTFK